jgi:dTMP kinase
MSAGIPGGFLIAIEGIDGTGKSLQARAVGRELAARGLECVLTREPTDSAWGRKLRDSAARGRLSPQEELEAFVEDRKEHVRGLIRPSLDQGKVVITDRYYFSTVAYQGARGFDPAELLRLNESVAIEPNLLVFIDLDPETGLARAGRHKGVLDHFETLDQLSRVRDIFLSVSKPYAVRFDGRAPAAQIRDEILLAFGRMATELILSRRGLTTRERLDAVLRVYGGKPASECDPL